VGVCPHHAQTYKVLNPGPDQPASGAAYARLLWSCLAVVSRAAVPLWWTGSACMVERSGGTGRMRADALCVLPAGLVIASGDSSKGLAGALGSLPAAMSGMAPTRRGRSIR
jgi:hypothetical protein